ncbi:hypothetical protein F4Z99_04120 [Candidatus Poribacteria bacterium]|nr:hypothetical protein [Candidatus Poribacteria bacterium]MYB02481.1 hypothetical protein [Candidatus Poribacteria bacterium]
MTYLDLTDPNINLHGTTGNITQEDINEGVRCDHETCALAKAVERMLPGYTIFVDDYIAVNDTKGEIVCEMAITNQLLEWIDDFDNKRPVQPVPLVIYKSTVGVNKWILCMGEDDHDRDPV